MPLSAFLSPTRPDALPEAQLAPGRGAQVIRLSCTL